MGRMSRATKQTGTRAAQAATSDGVPTESVPSDPLNAVRAGQQRCLSHHYDIWVLN